MKKHFNVLLVFTFFFFTFAKGDEFDDFLSEEKRKPEIERKQPLSEIASPIKQEKKKTLPSEEFPLGKKILSSFKRWTLLTATPMGKTTCYAVVYSKHRIGNTEKNESEIMPYLMVHYFPVNKYRVSIFLNYKVQTGSKIFLSVDRIKQFELQSSEQYPQYAISEDSETDVAIVSALLTANEVNVRGEGASEGGETYSVDTYDVSGFANIYSKMKSSCPANTI